MVNRHQLMASTTVQDHPLVSENILKHFSQAPSNYNNTKLQLKREVVTVITEIFQPARKNDHK